jgi:hypothetical protein
VHDYLFAVMQSYQMKQEVLKMSEQATTARTRTGGRSSHHTLWTVPNFEMLPGLTREVPLCEVMDGAQVDRIMYTSMSFFQAKPDKSADQSNVTCSVV